MISETELSVHVHSIPHFWDMLLQADETFLGLDYDGTLALFHEGRMEAVPEPGISRLLKEIRRSTATEVVIISGRPVSELVCLLGNIGCMLIGSHGYETLTPDGSYCRRDIGDLQSHGLSLAEELGEKEGLRNRLEVKIASVALHTRGLPTLSARQVEERIWHQWEQIGDTHDLEPRRFNGGIELRTRGWDKGEVLRELLDARSSNIFAVYVGDDETDEDAFAVIRNRGVGIKVGEPHQVTAAAGFLADVSRVKIFLESWLRNAPRRTQGG